MKIAIPKEVHAEERRVAATAETVRQLVAQGFEVLVEAGAGAASSVSDAAYTQTGATVVHDKRALWNAADIVLKVRAPELAEVELFHEGQTLISFLYPAENKELVEKLRARKVTALAMEAVPRISRAQKLDALSSMANIAGYRAVIEAAQVFGRFFTGQVTAAGKVPPAKVLVIGAGVAGLSAIGVAGSLGAVVRAFDTRLQVKDEVRSLGAEFLELDFSEQGEGQGGYAKLMSPEFIAAEMALFRAQAKEVDIIITTAMIPGRPAPRLLPADVVALLKPGSVIVDLAAETGGNCELTRKGERYTTDAGVTIIGYTDMASRLAPTASQLYGSNLVHLLREMSAGTGFHVDLNDEVVRAMIVTHQGELLWPPPKPQEPALVKPKPSTTSVVVQPPKPAHGSRSWLAIFLLLPVLAIGLFAPPEFLGHFTVFVLACFVGWQVVWNVTPALHTPLMSVTNAISGIILLGGMLKISGGTSSLITLLAALAVLISTINIAGGFLVTQRMLKMFTRQG